MSWVKRRGASAPNASPQVPMYNPNQHSTQEMVSVINIYLLQDSFTILLKEKT